MSVALEQDVLDILQDKELISKLGPYHGAAYATRIKWLSGAFNHQKLPQGTWWSIWLMLAGRGAGKTRTAAEQLWWWAWENPGTRWLVMLSIILACRG